MGESLGPKPKRRKAGSIVEGFILPEPAGNYKALRHSSIGREGHILTVCCNAQDCHVRILLGNHLSEAMPRQAVGDGQGEDQGKDAARLKLLVGQRRKCRGDASIAVIAGVVCQSVGAASP